MTQIVTDEFVEAAERLAETAASVVNGIEPPWVRQGRELRELALVVDEFRREADQR